jgi:hypothetical protein
VKQGVDAKKVEAIIDEELKKLLAEGPSATELSQARTVFKAGFIRGIERIGGFGGKADTLAECTVYTGKPDCYRESLKTIETATAADLKSTGQRWLGKGDHTLVIEPGARTALPEEPAVAAAALNLPKVDAKYKTTATLDRKAGVQVPKTFPDLKFRRCSARRCPTARRCPGRAPRRAGRADQNLFEAVTRRHRQEARHRQLHHGDARRGAGQYDALRLRRSRRIAGRELGAAPSLDGGTVYLSSLKDNLARRCAVRRHAAAAALRAKNSRTRARAVAGRHRAGEGRARTAAATRVLPPLLYGPSHAVRDAVQRHGTEVDQGSLTRDDLLAFHAHWVRPNGATLVVVGDTTLTDIVPLLRSTFGDWKRSDAPQRRPRSTAARPSQPRVFLIDQPARCQANIYVGELMPSTMDPARSCSTIANAVLGGDFSARLNMNLREDKHWSYGARSRCGCAGPAPWLAFAPVQIDKASESIGRDAPRDQRVRRRRARGHRGGSRARSRRAIREPAGCVRDRRFGDGPVARHRPLPSSGRLRASIARPRSRHGRAQVNPPPRRSIPRR